MDDDIYEVSSELYEEYDYTSPSRPMVNPKNVVGKFSFKLPGYSIEDSDGDLMVPRKHTEQTEHIEIEHSYSTSLNLVGLQVWRGALLLADWLLHNGNRFRRRDEHILELGSGVGLTSIVASMFSPVLCTDVNRGEILDIMRANAVRNLHFSKHPIEVVELDFTAATVPDKIVSLLPKISVVLAADVVYDDHLTEAFVQTVQRLLDIPPGRSVYVALEKRYVFTISDCDTCAPCYDYFLEQINSLKGVTVEEVKIDFPQYFQYERCKELVLWKITSKF